MDEKQNGKNQSGYDQKTFGQVNRDPYGQNNFNQATGNSNRYDSYNYSQKFSGQQGAFGQPGTGQSHAQFGQRPPDGGAFYHSGEPPRGMGFGIASMVLGIVSLVLFCTCINVPLAIVAVIFGIVHVARHTESNGFAIAGIVTSIISVILMVILAIVLYISGVNSAATWLYNGYFPFEDGIYDHYDYYDGYEYEDDYDDYFDGKDYEGVDF